MKVILFVCVELILMTNFLFAADHTITLSSDEEAIMKRIADNDNNTIENKIYLWVRNAVGQAASQYNMQKSVKTEAEKIADYAAELKK